MKEFILEVKNNKPQVMKGIPAEFLKIFCTMRDGIETLANMFKKFRNGKEFPLDWKVAVIYPIYKGKGLLTETRKLLLLVCGKIFLGILVVRPRGWLIITRPCQCSQCGLLRANEPQVFFLIRTIEKYLRFKLRCLYWCFVDSEEILIFILRESLW